MKHANKFNTAKFSTNQRIGNNLIEKQEQRQKLTYALGSGCGAIFGLIIL